MQQSLKGRYRISEPVRTYVNYGGGDQKAADTLEIPIEQAQAMNKGYTDAFPMVITYQQKVEQAMRRGYAVNLYGRRYYISNPRNYYKCANYLIQGSCADMLKQKMIDIDGFLLKNKCASKLVLCIHDELIFEVVKGEDWIIPVIKEMMENNPEIKVPIVAEVECTASAWADKSKVIGL